ncbi:MAG: hypothetical protein KDC24_07650, partial [Saprospiraceae bacterium]|nr:hypothetical protein [Saprospiraceae bacterium]
MKAIFLIFFCFLFASLPVGAQVEFFNTYGRPSLDESFHSIFPSDEPGQMWVAGQTGTTGNDEIFLMVIDTLGNIIWSDTFGEPDINENITAFDRNPTNGNMAIGVRAKHHDTGETNGILYLFDKNGHVNSITADHDSYHFSQVTVLENGMAIALGYSKTSNDYARTFFSPQGEIIEKQRFLLNFPTCDCPQSIVAAQDGNYYTLENYRSDSQKNSVSLQRKNGTTGQTWYLQLNDLIGAENAFSSSVIQTQNGKEFIIYIEDLIAGKSFLLKVDTNQVVHWQVETSAFIGANHFYPYLFIDTNGLIGVLSGKGIETRDLSTGMLLHKDTSLNIKGRTAIFEGNSIFVAGETEKGDAYLGKFKKGDISLDQEFTFGIQGNGTEDFNPYHIYAGNSFYQFNNAYRDLLDRHDLLVRKIDGNSGSTTWEKDFTNNHSIIGHSLNYLSDGNILITTMTTTSKPPVFQDSILLLKLNAVNGNEIWRIKLPNESGREKMVSVATPDGGAILFFLGTVHPTDNPNSNLIDQFQSLKINAQGELIWRKWYDKTSYPDVQNIKLNGIQYANNGDILVYGSKSKTKGVLVRINAEDGDVIQSITLEDFDDPYNRWQVQSIQEDSNNNLLMLV